MEFFECLNVVNERRFGLNSSFVKILQLCESFSNHLFLLNLELNLANIKLLKVYDVI